MIDVGFQNQFEFCVFARNLLERLHLLKKNGETDCFWLATQSWLYVLHPAVIPVNVHLPGKTYSTNLNQNVFA